MFSLWVRSPDQSPSPLVGETLYTDSGVLTLGVVHTDSTLET